MSHHRRSQERIELFCLFLGLLGYLFCLNSPQITISNWLNLQFEEDGVDDFFRPPLSPLAGGLMICSTQHSWVPLLGGGVSLARLPRYRIGGEPVACTQHLGEQSAPLT